MPMIKSWCSFPVILALLLVAGCGSSESVSSGDLGQPAADTAGGADTLYASSEPSVTGTAEVAENAVVLDEVRSAAAVVSADGLVFDAAGNEDLLELETGAVLVGTAGQGFLRKVDSVSSDGSQITVTTSRATLEDLFGDADFTIEIPVLGDEMPADSVCPACSASPWVDLDFGDTVMFEKREGEGVHETLCKGTLTEGHVRFAPKFSFQYVKSFFSGLHYFSFSADAHFEAKLAAEFVFYMMQLEKKQDFPLVSKSFTVMVGTVPVVVTPQLSLEIGAEAILQQGWGRVAAGMEATADFGVTVEYMRGDEQPWSGWTRGGFDVEALPFETDGSWFLEGKLKGLVNLKASLQVYDIAGPYLTLGPFVEMNYKADGCDDDPAPDCVTTHAGGGVNYVAPWTWELRGGVEAGAGVAAEAFGWEIFDFNRNFFSTGGNIAEGTLALGDCDIEAARTCFFEEAQAVRDACMEGCEGSAPCEADDWVCQCNNAACPTDCLAEYYHAQSRCFDAHGCDVILEANTEASVECQQENAESYAACMRREGANDHNCTPVCQAEHQGDYEECMAFHYAGIVEDVLGVDVGNQ